MEVVFAVTQRARPHGRRMAAHVSDQDAGAAKALGDDGVSAPLSSRFYRCRGCNVTKAAVDFYSCNLRNWTYCCKVCATRRVTEMRRLDPVKRFSNRVRAKERRAGRAMTLTVADIRGLLAAAGVEASALDRLLSMKLIAIVRISEGCDDKAPLSRDNAAVAVVSRTPGGAGEAGELRDV